MINPIALRKAKIAYNFGLSECNRVKAELQIRGGIEDNSKIISLISQRKHML